MMNEREHARYLLKKARYKLAEAAGYARTVNVGKGELLATEINWLVEDITAHLNDYQQDSAANDG